NVSGCCIVTESDIDLEVEYREQADKTFPDNESVTDSNTIEVMSTDFHHNRVSGDPLSKLPVPQRMAVLATMDEIRWLLEDEIVSALRHSRVINTSVLQKVADHVYCSSGRPQCHYEVVPLQFVFGPEQSLEKFKEDESVPTDNKVEAQCEPILEPSNLNHLEQEEDKDQNVGNSAGKEKSCSNTGSTDKTSEHGSPPKTTSADSGQSVTSNTGKVRPSRVQSVVSSQGSLDSDMLGYDGGSSESECEDSTKDEQEPRCPLMPEFWIIVKIDQDRVVVYSHSRICNESQENIMGETEKEDDEMPEHLQLHQIVVRKIGEMCRIVNQRLLLQDLHDSHVCNSLLVAESEEDIWKNESLYRQRMTNSDDYTTEENYQPRNYLAATMQFMPGHFACDVVWSTVIPIHSRLKMGPNMGVSRAIQALRSVLNAFCVVNRKNMFVYQERTTKSVFYLRLSETHQTGKVSDLDGNSLHVSRSVGLARSQEPVFTEDLLGSRSSLEGSRPIGQVDKHILLRVHGVSQAGPEITDELVKVLRKRLDEATLDIITVMLVRNCKLTPSDVEFIQPPGSASTEVIAFLLPQYSLPWIQAVAHYLRQNLLIFLHIPKYTDSNIEHHFKHYFHLNCELPDSDIYLYNKPGGQGTGGKGIACIALSFVDAQGNPWQVPAQGGSAPSQGDTSAITLHSDQFESLTRVVKVDSHAVLTEAQICVRFDIWEQGNVSPLELTDKLQGALRHALCDVIMELKVLPNPLCLETFCLPTAMVLEQRENTNTPSTTPSTGTNTPESTTPTGKTVRRSFWEILPFPTSGHFILIGRNFHQWRYSTEQENCSDEENTPVVNRSTPRKGLQRFEALEQCDWFIATKQWKGVAPRQRFLIVQIVDKKVTLCIYNWSVDLGASLIRELIRLVQWQNARSHVVHCLLSQKMGLFHHCCFSDPPANEDLKQEPNPFLNSTLDADALLRSPVPPVPSKDQGRLSSSGRNLHLMHFPHELVPFDEALREISIGRAIACMHDSASGMDTVSWHGAQLLEIKAAERREMEKQMKIENLFVTWQQRSAQSNMPISVADLDTLKQSSRLVHYCATPLLFDPIFRKQIQEDQVIHSHVKKRHRSNDSTFTGRDRSCNTDAADMLPSRLREEAWLQDISNTFLQQYVQYLQSIGFILVQVRPPSPMRSIARARAAAFSSHSTEGRASFSYNKQKSEESPKQSSGLGTTAYHLQRALPGGIVLMELAFQGCYFCVKQYALECSRIPMGQTVNSQVKAIL
ncbi:hypothetical protein Z043_105959, partial [Scleropages formosus]